MPEWVVHLYTGERFCGIQRGVYEEVNRFIDSPESSHDVNRVIIDGHWIPEALLYLAFVCYERWGYEGLKACLHHHILDYSKTLASGGPHGHIVKSYRPGYSISVLKFAYKVLDYIQKDFSTLSTMLKEGRDPHDILRVIEKSWFGGIKYHDSFLDILKRRGRGLHEFIDNLLRVVEELKGCTSISIEEVAWLTWRDQENGLYRDVCPVCKKPVAFPEAYTLIPNEYVRKNLAYKVHVNCFELLKGKARDFAKQGLSGKDIFRRLLVETSIPPTIAYEVLKSENLVQEWRDIAFPEEGLQRDISFEEEGLSEEWERLKKECVESVERTLAHISPAAQIISYKRVKPMPMPERVVEFYMTLERTLGKVKPDAIRLLKEGRRGEAESMLKTIIGKMFLNPLITTFPPNAFVGVRDKVALTIRTMEGLASICELAGVRIDVKTEWSRSELLNLLDSIYDRVDWVAKEWIDVLKAQIV
jgi:hypothetical protein